MINSVRSKCCEPQVQAFGKHNKEGKKSTAKKVAVGVGTAAAVATAGLAIYNRKNIGAAFRHLKAGDMSVKEIASKAFTKAKTKVTEMFAGAKEVVSKFTSKLKNNDIIDETIQQGSK